MAVAESREGNRELDLDGWSCRHRSFDEPVPASSPSSFYLSCAGFSAMKRTKRVTNFPKKLVRAESVTRAASIPFDDQEAARLESLDQESRYVLLRLVNPNMHVNQGD